ncbi:GDSL-type esterase/lipase family protein [Aneurinibacillus sp. Ricciae_BoGa-3]|uniref:GDSL-type esterase/lipase family protein n=1 Tax=Aneurinibacillus sp. Ricciae_BoGa-3 TaxID=3022697 RepID=UPI0023418F26|nr:GDSL-type esterase/lipase family protein [Aneurinibacillus sp. Ricciae_BoGa-3]WCK52676.1 GDSL-type esterase/lipase family protein [Aneurinibacillus sp. Ricciae_BoGa-3]
MSLSKTCIRFFVILAVLFFSVLNSTPHVDAFSQKESYLALGDSLAAGQTPYGHIGSGYADYVAAKLKAAGYLKSFTKKYAIPGYTTDRVLRDIEDNNKGIKQSIAQSTLITLDVGADDIINSVHIDAKNGQIAYDFKQTAMTFLTIGTNVRRVIQDIQQVNPTARIYLLGYYNPFPGLPESVQNEIRPLLDGLNGALKEAAQQSGATYISTANALSQNTKKYLPNPYDIHPSTAGYQEIAAAIWNHMQTDLMQQSTQQPSTSPSSPFSLAISNFLLMVHSFIQMLLSLVGLR